MGLFVRLMGHPHVGEVLLNLTFCSSGSTTTKGLPRYLYGPCVQELALDPMQHSPIELMDHVDAHLIEFPLRGGVHPVLERAFQIYGHGPSISIFIP